MVGVSLSPKQVARAEQLSAAVGLADKCQFQVADALDMPFPDSSFDFVWSLESGEHMPDKVGRRPRILGGEGSARVAIARQYAFRPECATWNFCKNDQ